MYYIRPSRLSQLKMLENRQQPGVEISRPATFLKNPVDKRQVKRYNNQAFRNARVLEW